MSAMKAAVAGIRSAISGYLARTGWGQRVLAFVDYVWFVIAKPIRVIIAVAIVLEAVLLAVGLIWPETGLIFVIVSTGVVIVVTLAVEVLRLLRKLKDEQWKSYSHEPYDPGAILGHDDHQWLDCGQTWVYTSPTVNSALDSILHDVQVIEVEGDFQLPKDLRIKTPALLRSRRNDESGEKGKKRKKALRFNRPKARLNTELTTGGLSQVHLQKVDYFSGECSNEVWSLRPRNSGNDGDHPLKQMVQDQKGHVLPLHQAKVANILGVTCLAVTSDGYLLLNQQSERNSIAPGALSASGSGSMEWEEDFRVWSDKDFRTLVREAMMREIIAECAVTKEALDEDSFRLTGYFRWADRAFKPELTGYIRVNQSWGEVKGARLSRGERNFTDQVLVIPLENVTSIPRDPLLSRGEWETDFEPVAESILTILKKEERYEQQPGTWEASFNPSLVAAMLAYQSLQLSD